MTDCAFAAFQIMQKSEFRLEIHLHCTEQQQSG